MIVHVGIHKRELTVLNKLQRKIHQGTAEGHEYACLEHLGTSGKLAQGVDGYKSCHNLDDDELILVLHGYGANEYHCYMRDKRRARIHKHSHEYWSHGKRHDVDTHVVVAHHQRHYHGE